MSSPASVGNNESNWSTKDWEPNSPSSSPLHALINKSRFQIKLSRSLLIGQCLSDFQHHADTACVVIGPHVNLFLFIVAGQTVAATADAQMIDVGAQDKPAVL